MLQFRMNLGKTRCVTFLLLFFPVACVIVGTAYVVLERQRVSFQDALGSKDLRTIEVERQVLATDIDVHLSDTLFLAALVRQRLAHHSFPKTALDILKEEFREFAIAREVYTQVRLLDASGRELLRVNAGMTGVTIADAQELQDKSDRDYFKKGIQTDQGVHISRFDLNVEEGNVEWPPNPTLRFSTVVRDVTGEKVGLVVLNFSGKRLLSRIRFAGREAAGVPYLVNDQGYWIIGPSPEQEWGFQLDGREGDTLFNLYPEAWKSIRIGEKGQFVTEEGMFTFQRVRSASSSAQESWILVSHIPGEYLAPAWSSFAWHMVVVMLFAWGLMSQQVARTRMQRQQAINALQRSERRFRDISDAAGEFIWETDTSWTITYVSSQVRSVLGYDPASVVGNSIYDYILSDQVPSVRKWLESMGRRRKKRVTGVEYQAERKDGVSIWLRVNSLQVFDEENRHVGYRGASLDVTRSKEAEQAVVESEEKLRLISDSSQDAIIMIDEHGGVRFWNPAAEKLFGYTSAEIMGKKIHNHLVPMEKQDDEPEGPSEGEPVMAKEIDCMGSGAVRCQLQEMYALRSNGAHVPVEVSVSRVPHEGQWWSVASIRDITERKAAEEQLRAFASTDSLTGLSNRRFFLETANRECDRMLRYGSRVSVIMLDVDHFKDINDTYGHDVGDAVLRELASVCRKGLREVDVIGRLGGEEFAVLLPETDEPGAVLVAERMRQAVSRIMVESDKGPVHLTISLGVAQACGDGNVEQLLKRADKALYRAKSQGRNQVVAETESLASLSPAL